MPEEWAECKMPGCHASCGSSEEFCAVHRETMRTGEPMEIAWQILKAGPPAEAFLPHDVDDEGNVIEHDYSPPKKDPLFNRLSLQHLARRGDDHAKEMGGERPLGEDRLPEQHMAGQHENTRMNEMAREAAGTRPDPHELEPNTQRMPTTLTHAGRSSVVQNRLRPGFRSPEVPVADPKPSIDLNTPEIPVGYDEEEEPEGDLESAWREITGSGGTVAEELGEHLRPAEEKEQQAQEEESQLNEMARQMGEKAENYFTEGAERSEPNTYANMTTDELKDVYRPLAQQFGSMSPEEQEADPDFMEELEEVRQALRSAEWKEGQNEPPTTESTTARPTRGGRRGNVRVQPRRGTPRRYTRGE